MPDINVNVENGSNGIENLRIIPKWHKVTCDADLPIDVDEQVLLIVRSEGGYDYLSSGECVSKKDLYYLPSYLKDDGSKYIFEKTLGDYEIDYIAVSDVLYWTHFNILLTVPNDVNDACDFDEDHTWFTDSCVFVN